MIRRNSRQFSDTLLLASHALLIGLLATTAAPAFAQVSGSWAKTGSLSAARINHTSTLLANGQVLVAGGAAGSYLTSAELYAASTGKWSVTGSMNTARAVHTATLLQNG